MEVIWKWVLKNAIEHDGKALSKAVLPKVLGERPELRENIRGLMEEIEKVVEEVNSLSLEEQKERLRGIAPELLEKKEVKKELPELPNAEKGKVVLRLPPEPSKYLHIGHAIGFYINYLYAKKYDGKLILRFEDTNPTKVKEEYYEGIRKDLRKIGIKWDEEVIMSERLKLYYGYAEKLIEEGHAYVCTCEEEVIRKNRWERKECKCRFRSIEENMDLWKRMHEELYPGEAILRLRGDMKSDDAAMRDPTLFRIITDEHPLQGKKYRVWPTYDFAVSIEDGLSVTHVLRSSEFLARTNLQNHLRSLLGLRNPTIIHYSRINIIGFVTKGREIRKLISEGKISGWDDPRLVTIRAILRRGIHPKTIERLAKEVGLSLAQTNLEWDMIAGINREMIDDLANRYFFVPDPVRIEVKGAPKVTAKLKLHPNHPERGLRVIKTKGVFYIPKEEARPGLIRLKDLYNVELKKERGGLVGYYAGKEISKEVKKIQWVTEENVEVKVLVPDGLKLREVKGLGEKGMEKLRKGEIIQMERFGFGRVDEKKPLTIIFGHR